MLIFVKPGIFSPEARSDLIPAALRGLRRQLLKRLLLFQPLLISALLLHHDSATHGVVPDAAQFGAQGLVCPGLGGGEPEIGDHARDTIHLGAELGDIEVMQHIYGSERQLDRLADREVQCVALDHDVVMPMEIIRIHTEWIVRTDCFAYRTRPIRRPSRVGG